MQKSLNKEINAKLEIIAHKFNMTLPSFRRFCCLDYLYRNKHLIPSKDEWQQLSKEAKNEHTDRADTINSEEE